MSATPDEPMTTSQDQLVASSTPASSPETNSNLVTAMHEVSTSQEQQEQQEQKQQQQQQTAVVAKPKSASIPVPLIQQFPGDFQQFVREELSNLYKIGWTNWVTVMVLSPDYKLKSHYSKRSPGNYGYYVHGWGNDPAFQNCLDSCGVFEFRIVKGKEEKIVSIGSPTLNEPGYRMRDFIQIYLETGGDLDVHFNRAITRNYMIQVRVYAATSAYRGPVKSVHKHIADGLRECMLERLDYAWMPKPAFEDMPVDSYVTYS